MLETPYFKLLRKPAGIPSSRGAETCFLDYLKKDKLNELYEQKVPLSKGETKRSEEGDFLDDPELGLLNRLDTPTQGLLYFAKDQAAKDLYASLQKEHKITKYYVAEVYGKLRPAFGRIKTPIAHHRDDASKMVAVVSGDESYRSTPQQATTYFEQLEYDETSDTTTLHIEITKGVRHQIRVHLASIGHPIINDLTYTTKKFRKKVDFEKEGTLGLMSVGLKYNML